MLAASTPFPEVPLNPLVMATASNYHRDSGKLPQLYRVLKNQLLANETQKNQNGIAKARCNSSRTCPSLYLLSSQSHIQDKN